MFFHSAADENDPLSQRNDVKSVVIADTRHSVTLSFWIIDKCNFETYKRKSKG